MEATQINKLVQSQRHFFLTGTTLDVNVRIDALKKLYSAIKKHENEIYDALYKDLGKSQFESYMCEVGLTLSEISYMLKHIRKFSREKNVPTPLAQFHSRSFKKPSPRGVVLIMSPWNYPFLLTMEPLVDAIAAGNTAILKPSAYSPYVSDVMCLIIKEVFDPAYVSVVTGGRAENNCLLNEHFDYIFFTGSQAVGKEVMRKAAEYLTPVTLELGGKSPCIVTESADLKLAARRIVFGKFLNCGQTCVAPDYIYVQDSIKDQLVKELINETKRQFTDSPLNNNDYGKIVNEKHFNRISGLINNSKVVLGGASNADSLRIEPTIMDNVTFDDAVMQEEIFGPLMPILTFHSVEDAVNTVNAHMHPLALYIFTKNKKEARYVTSRCNYGGGCINDTIIHLATSKMGFGGFGESGMGKEQIAREIKEASGELEEIRKEYMKLHNTNERNREIRDNLKRNFEKNSGLQKQYEIVGNLSKTANGNLSGSAKLDFETYIQRQYFRQIIRAANKRLVRMTSGEFILQCRDVEKLGSQGQAGLDLDVYHMATDTVRDVKTLSGGESFMAALSMALGLSDIVQNTAGAIHLDTMFIDEGFGSLDDVSRDQAIRVLNDLADKDRLIGIISHVNELKEQIDHKLVVKKNEKGSSVSWSL